MRKSPVSLAEIEERPAEVEPIRLFKMFADFLLARSALLTALRSEGNGGTRPALRGACVQFHRLAAELMPGTPEEILSALSKTVVLNVCRAAGALEAIEALNLRADPPAAVVDLASLGGQEKGNARKERKS